MMPKVILLLVMLIVDYYIVVKYWKNQFFPTQRSRIELFIVGFLSASVLLSITNPEDFKTVRGAISLSLIGGSITGLFFAIGIPRRYRYFVTHIQPPKTKSQPSDVSKVDPKVDRDPS